MPIASTDRIATGAQPGGHGATTPSGGTSRRSRLGFREGRDGPGGARRLATGRGGARRAQWCAFSAVLADLRCRLLTAETKAVNLAFAVLRKHSQDHNVKVRDLAEEVIHTGSL
jgi:hypothetical protein